MSKSRFIVGTICVLLAIWGIHSATNHVRKFGPIAGHTTPATEGPIALVRSLRPSYPYSVIAGGAYSPVELQFADGKDSIVREHYSDFDVKHAKVVRLTDDRFQYVSYRLKDQVFWTKKKLRIPSGELLLTDGVHYARTRCGNRLSDKPHKAVSANEPDPALLSLPPVNLDLLPKLALAHPEFPGVLLPLESRTSAVAPQTVAPWPVEAPLVPVAPIWGGQPVVAGPSGFLPSTPPIPEGGTASSPILPTTPVTPPIEPGKTPPGNIEPVPEPSSIYLFLLASALFAGWASSRMLLQDAEEKTQ